jgi:hypothetical protein
MTCTIAFIAFLIFIYIYDMSVINKHNSRREQTAMLKERNRCGDIVADLSSRATTTQESLLLSEIQHKISAPKE